MLHFIMDEGDVEHVLKHLSMIGSDGSSLRPEGPWGGASPTPAATAASPASWPTTSASAPALLEEAVRKMTSAPATRLGLKGKDCCGGGWTPTWSSSIPRPCATRPPSPSLTAGVRHVIVDGTLTVRDGEHTGSRAGRVLRRG